MWGESRNYWRFYKVIMLVNSSVPLRVKFCISEISPVLPLPPHLYLETFSDLFITCRMALPNPGCSHRWGSLKQMFLLASVASKYWLTPNLLPSYRILELQGWSFLGVSKSALSLDRPPPPNTNVFQPFGKAELMEDLCMIPPKIPDRASFGNAMFWHTMAT